MSYVGELVRMENGRWARFQNCRVIDGDTEQPTMLVAVELDEDDQERLNATEGTLEQSGTGELDPDTGDTRLSFDSVSPAL